VRTLKDSYAGELEEEGHNQPRTLRVLDIGFERTVRCIALNFHKGGHRVHRHRAGDVGRSNSRGNPPRCGAIHAPEVAREARKQYGPARVVTAANCFAHMKTCMQSPTAVIEGARSAGFHFRRLAILLGCLTACSTLDLSRAPAPATTRRKPADILEMHGSMVPSRERESAPDPAARSEFDAARKGAAVQPSVQQCGRASREGKEAMPRASGLFPQRRHALKLRLLRD